MGKADEDKELLRWFTPSGVECRVMRKNGMKSQTWAEAWYSGNSPHDRVPGWRMWLQAAEANAIVDAHEEKQSAKYELDDLTLKHQEKVLEAESLKQRVKELEEEKRLRDKAAKG